MKTRHLLPASLAVLFALVPRAGSAQYTDSTANHTTVTTTVSSQTVVNTTISPTDSSIAVALIAANQKEVAEAEAAISQTESDRVKEFARRLQRDHAKAIEDLQAFLQKSHGGMSSGMAGDSAKAAPPSLEGASYQGKTGKDFDKAWIEAITTEHRLAIDDLRDNVIPKIQDSSLKALAQGLLPVMGTHLREAEQIQAELK
jgi:putative membrane protein